MSNTSQKILGYLKIIDNTSPIFNPGRKVSRLVKRRDEIVLEITKRDNKQIYYEDDPTAKYFMKRPCDLKKLLPLSCDRKIEILCGQDDCSLEGFGKTITLNNSGGRIVDGDGGGGGGGGSIGGGGPPCLNPPCINVNCPNPPCSQEDCAEGEEYNSETGECEPPPCQNPVGSGDCCFDSEQNNCVYVTCYKVVTEPGEEGDCCEEPSFPFDPNNPCPGQDLVCPDCYPPSYKICPVTEQYCFTEQDENGYLVFSLEGNNIRFDPNAGQFIPPSGEPDIECPADGTPCSFCLTLPCGEENGYTDDPPYIGCQHGPSWVGIPTGDNPGNPYDDSDDDNPRFDEIFEEFFDNSVNICNDPDGECTRFRIFRYCVCPPGPSNGYKSTYAEISVPECTVSWRPPSESEPPQLYPIAPGPGGGEWSFEWEWTPGGSVGGGPSSSCDCG